MLLAEIGEKGLGAVVYITKSNIAVNGLLITLYSFIPNPFE